MSTDVSVIVPTYNRRASLRRTLDALEHQCEGSPAHEVVVVDDGSTDGTSAMVQADFPSARLLYVPNGGPGAARNHGVGVGGGWLLAFLDDDVVPSPTWLRELVAPFQADPSLAAVGGAIEPLHGGFWSSFVQQSGLVSHAVDRATGDVRYLVTANAAVRREAFQRVGGFHPELLPKVGGEDVDLTRRLLAAGLPVRVLDDTGRAQHDHRAAPRAILRTFFLHGTVRDALAAAHPTFSSRRGILRLASARIWLDRYLRLRQSGSAIPTAVAMLALQGIGYGAYGAGVIGSRWRRRTQHRRRL